MQALTAYSEAIKVIKVDDPLWSEVVSNLADVFRKLGRYDEARDLYLKSLQKLESMYGGYGSIPIVCVCVCVFVVSGC